MPLPSGNVWRDRLIGAVAHGDGDKDWAVMALEQARASGFGQYEQRVRFLPAASGRPAARRDEVHRLPKYNFTGGNDDSDELPLDGLVAAANAVLKREGRKLATYASSPGRRATGRSANSWSASSSATPASSAPPTKSW